MLVGNIRMLIRCYCTGKLTRRYVHQDQGLSTSGWDNVCWWNDGFNLLPCVISSAIYHLLYLYTCAHYRRDLLFSGYSGKCITMIQAHDFRHQDLSMNKVQEAWSKEQIARIPSLSLVHGATTFYSFYMQACVPIPVKQPILCLVDGSVHNDIPLVTSWFLFAPLETPGATQLREYLVVRVSTDETIRFNNFSDAL